MNESGPSIDVLLQQARAGDTQALNRLLDIYRNYLSLLAPYDMRRSSGAVRMLWARALERLRDELEQPR